MCNVNGANACLRDGRCDQQLQCDNGQDEMQCKYMYYLHSIVCKIKQLNKMPHYFKGLY